MATLVGEQSSFRVYLPSNASADVYPNNSPSCYTTRLRKPIQLDGDWEVGVESISYNTNIGNPDEQATIDAAYTVIETYTINDSVPTKYKISADNK